MVWEQPDEPRDEGNEPNDAATAPRAQWHWVAGATAVVAVVAVVVWTFGGADVADDLADDDAPITEPVLDTLPDPDDSTDVTVDFDDPVEEGSDDNGDGADSGGAAGGPSITVELPPAVATIEAPTEVVVLTTSGLLHTLSLPSGVVRTDALGPGNFGSLTVSPDAALLTNYDNRDPLLVPRTSPPVSIDGDDLALDDGTSISNLDGYGWVEEPDGSTSFLAVGFAENLNSRRHFLVRADGSIAADPADAANSNFFFSLPSPGVRVANDAGGVYRIEADGSSTQISSGFAIAGSTDQTLVRTCDSTRICGYALQPIDGSEAVAIDPAAHPALARAEYGATMSPDGSAISYVDFAGDQQLIVVDLVSGDTQEASITSTGFGRGAAWTEDGGGVFLSGSSDGLAFFERATGEFVEFGEELGQVVSVGIRYPDAELVQNTITAGELSFSSAVADEIGVDIVTVGPFGDMSYVDLDAATSATWDTPGVPGFPLPQLFSSGNQVLAVSGNGERAYLSEFGTGAELDADELFEPPYLPGPPAGTIWVRSPTAALDVDAVLVGLDGQPRSDGVAVTVDDATMLGGDGAGGLVVATGGDVYVSAGGDAAGFTTGLNRLTTGELLAVGTSHALVRECDAVRECTTLHIDRATGDPTEVDVSQVIGADALDVEREVSTVGSMSPDGDVVLARFTKAGTGEDPPTEVQTWALVDLATGVRTAIMEPSRDQPMIWNDESSYAVFAADGRLHVYERSTSAVIEVAGVSDVRALTEVDAEFGTVDPASGQG